jgi:D-glycero-D-manno-heptose 1,7-bisphosphate phosphatase
MGILDLKRSAVFLDRDGVLNRAYLQPDGKTHPPASAGDVEILPKVPEACLALRRAGYLLIVVTNQPDVGRGAQKLEVAEAINATLLQQLPLDEIRVCYHDNGDNCSCRKPQPGLLLSASLAWGIDLAQSFMVGDRWSDIEAGRNAGCRTVFIGAKAPDQDGGGPDFQAASLYEAVAWILQGQLKS